MSAPTWINVGTGSGTERDWTIYGFIDYYALLDCGFRLAPTAGTANGVQPISPAILNRVDFERSRVRPNFSLDLAAGLRLWERDAQSVSLQFDMRNATDRLNVINFTGLFSGTALAPGRQITFQIKTRF